MSQRFYKVGSRASALAQRQTQLVLEALRTIPFQGDQKLSIEVKLIQTTGDKITQRPLADIGGKALFTKEIQQALLNKEIDFAVHSLKDLEHTLPQGLRLAAVLEREDCRDVLITNRSVLSDTLPVLKAGARVGTCSPRRAAQLLNKRPDLSILSLRGNVLSRLQKLERQDYDGIVLALAGLKRLGLWQPTNYTLKGYPYFKVDVLTKEEMIPAVGQGVIAVECREDDEEVETLLHSLNHSVTETCIRAERSLLKALGGNCHTAIAALATLQDPNILSLTACYFPNFSLTVPSRGFQKICSSEETGSVKAPEELGQQLALNLKNKSLANNL